MNAPVFQFTIREVDGSPSVSGVDTLVVPNGSLTDDGSGQVSLVPEVYDPNIRGWCLEFSGVPGCHLDLGPVMEHDAGTTFTGGFLVDTILCILPDHQSGYWLSPGYAGKHIPCLDGAQGDDVNGWTFTGNVCVNTFSGSTITETVFTSWSGVYVVSPGEYVYRAVRWQVTGTPQIQTFVNGLPDWCVRWAGPGTTSGEPSDSHFHIGGSGHSMLNGRIPVVRMWLGVDPCGAGAGGVNPELHFLPERQFGGFAAKVPCNILLDIASHPGALRVPDTSPAGWVSWTGGTPVWHDGRLCGAGSDGGTGSGFVSPNPAFSSTENPFAGALPQWVRDPANPYGTPVGQVAIPGGLPAASDLSNFAGAVLFDRGNKANSTLWNALVPSIGSCEAGSRPAEAWEVSTPGAFGILGKKFRYTGPGGTRATAFLNSGKADHDMRCLTVPFGERVMCGVAFRGVDHDNHWFVVMDTNLAVGGDPYDTFVTLDWGYYLAGTLTYVGGTSTRLGLATALRASCDPNGTTIRIYKDTTNTPVVTLTGQTALSSATKCGFVASLYPSTESSFWAAKDPSVW